MKKQVLEQKLSEARAERELARNALVGAILTTSDYRRRLDKAERALANELERTEPFTWDGKGSADILSRHAHVHSPEGACLKNRFGPQCPDKENS